MATRRIQVGSGLCLVPQHDPITLAKTVATLDRVSEGRFLFGIGGGWNVEEAANHGTDFSRRWKLMRERIEAMKAIWANEEAAYHGSMVDFEPIFSWPKPVQKPHPPIYIGGAAPWAIRRAVRYCDGWIPIGVRDDILGRIPELRRAAEEAGRDPDSLKVLIYWAVPDKAALEQYLEAGVSSAIFALPSVTADEAMPLLDRYAGLAESLG